MAGEHIDRGFIRLYRSQFDGDDMLWRRSKVKSEWEAWQYLLSLARWQVKPTERVVMGEKVTISRGEFLVSQRTLADTLGWGRQAVRGFLALLEKLDRIQPTTQPTSCRHKVCNYEIYNPVADGSNPPSNPTATQEQPSSNPVQEGKEGKERKNKANTDSPEAPKAEPSVPPVFTFDEKHLVGKGSGPWHVTPDLHKTLCDAYPSVDIPAEYRKMLAWLVSKPSGRKTRKGMPRFLNSWLARVQNAGGAKDARRPDTQQRWGEFSGGKPNGA